MEEQTEYAKKDENVSDLRCTSLFRDANQMKMPADDKNDQSRDFTQNKRLIPTYSYIKLHRCL
jgi:hypothetical protein